MADSKLVGSGLGTDPEAAAGAEARLRAAAEAAYAEAEAARFARLGALLLAEDRKTAAKLAARLEALEGAALAPEDIRSALAEHLVEALREARDKRGKALSSTLAPVVGGAIRAEIRNSRDEMAESLRPIAGRLVKIAVADSFKKLMQDVNARLDALTSAQGWGLRLRALATGRSVSELALAELGARGVSRILLIDRRSGGLIAQWPENAPAAGGGEMIGGMLTAILAFAEDALRSENGEAQLRSLDLDGRSWTIRPWGPRLLAVEEEGAASAEIRERMDEAAAGFLEGLGEAEEQPRSLTPLAQALLAAQKSGDAPDRRRRRRRRLIFVGALLTALLGLLGWRLWEAQGRAAALERVQAALYADPALEGAPFQVAWVDRGRLEARGVLPPGVDLEALKARLAEAGGEAYPVSARFAQGASAEAAGAEARLAALSLEVEALRRARAAAEAAAERARAEAAEEIARTRAETGEALEQALARLAEQNARLAALTASQAELSAGTRRLAAFAEEAAAPEARLRLWAARTAIFLPEGADLAAAGNLDALDEAAALLREPGAPRLRVVGYADRMGGAALNERLARERAQAVVEELVRRGAPADRLVALARLDPAEIAEAHGPGSRNRRVQFETAFPGE